MKIKNENFINSQVVLIGGGHSHIIFLKKFAMKKFLDTEVTLINPNSYLLYTGMIPGYISGHYSIEEIRVDLVKLCEFAQVRFIKEKVKDICKDKQEIILENNNVMGYDLLSIDIGVESKKENFISNNTKIKPLCDFVSNWDLYLKKIGKEIVSPNILIQGGGVAGVEIALSINFKLKRLNINNFNILIVDKSKILNKVNKRSKDILLKELANQKIKIFENILSNEEIFLKTLYKNIFDTDPNFFILSTGASPYKWIKNTHLELKNGYILVDEYLRACNDKKIFGVGDCIHFSKTGLSKSGVYAVRQSPVLYKNIKATLERKPLKKYKPQKSTLQLISLGKKSAIWDKGFFSFSGKSLWYLKNNIDKKFIKKFFIKKLDSDILKNKNPILCAGCGAKVGNNSLENVLSNLKQYQVKDLELGMGDDAAVLNINKKNLVFTTDHFRAFTTDLWLLSNIAAIHSMGDIWAMGAIPKIALANIIVPEANGKVQKNWLREIMYGSSHIFSKEKVTIVGGHTSVGKEFSIGFSINGFSKENPKKISGSQPGDLLILTKPIGSGVLLVGKMLFRVSGEEISNLFSWMSLSQSQAANILIRSNAMTDVTGFGLAGHLTKMCISSKTRAYINLKNIPFYKKSMELALQGIRSSLFLENYKFSENIIFKTRKNCDLLFDPQTSGGLLASIPPKEIDIVVDTLREKKIFFSIIGKIEKGDPAIIIDD